MPTGAAEGSWGGCWQWSEDPGMGRGTSESTAWLPAALPPLGDGVESYFMLQQVFWSRKQTADTPQTMKQEFSEFLQRQVWLIAVLSKRQDWEGTEAGESAGSCPPFEVGTHP